MARENARRVARFQHHRAGAVAKQHAGAAIVPVEDARIHFGGDHQHILILLRAQEQIGGRERVNKTAAYRLHVERRAVLDAELGLQDARRAREYHVRRGRCDDDEPDVLRGYACRLNRLAAGVERKITCALIVRRDVALTDAGAREYPLVGGRDDFFEVAIGEHFGRQITAGADDARIRHAAPSCTADMRSLM